ncbi:MAG: chemotaxis protein CheC [Deltaproteobacteria bacterium]|nr:chemotaxis protein CheC [Deltaproteobacteria bacterium]
MEAAPRPCGVAECAASEFLVTFQVAGDELGLCVVAYERAPAPATDEQRSMLTELANVLASKFVTQMADFNCCDIMVSPPTLAASGECETAGTRSRHRYLTSTLAVGGTHASVARRYELVGGAETLVFRLAYLPSLQGGNT